MYGLRTKTTKTDVSCVIIWFFAVYDLAPIPETVCGFEERAILQLGLPLLQSETMKDNNVLF